jgi:hypothetical protein
MNDLLTELRTLTDPNAIGALFVRAACAPGIDFEQFWKIVLIDMLARLAALEQKAASK